MTEPRRENASDSDTLNGDDDPSAEKKDEDSPEWDEGFVSVPVSPVPAHLRYPDKPSYSPPPLRPALKKMNTEDLEEGGVPHKRGVVGNLMSLYGLSGRKADRDDLTLSRDATTVPDSAQPGTFRPRAHRMDPSASTIGLADPLPLDPDHPFVTGVKRNTKGRGLTEKVMHRTSSRGTKSVTYHVASEFAPFRGE